jgi:hypothetical protein
MLDERHDREAARPDLRRVARPMMVVLALGLAVRLFVGLAFWGSEDVTLEIHYGHRILAGHDSWVTRLPVGYFLPPLMELLSRATLFPANAAQKLPAIIGDLITALLLWRIAEREQRSGPRWLWPAIYLLNPVTVMLSAYHGNVDPLMAAAMLWALDLRWRDRPVLAGVALALAITMKPTAVLALPPLMLPLSKRGVAFGATAAIVVAAICAPFAVISASGPAAPDPTELRFGHFLATYTSAYGNWGLTLIFRQLDQNVAGHLFPAAAKLLHAANAGLLQYGRYLLISILMAWFIYFAKRWRLASLADQALAIAATWLMFYVFATGWGVQYLSLALPFLLIGSLRLTTVYIAAVSPCLLTQYYYSSVFIKYGGERVVGRLATMPRTDLVLLIATHGFSLVAWGTCAWILGQIIVTNRLAPPPTAPRV